MIQEHPTVLAANGYPPKKHLLRDLRMSLVFEDDVCATICMPVVPEVCSDIGAIHPGVLAILTDVLGGFLAMKSFLPDWMATANLSLHTTGRISCGMVSATGHMVRSGRTTATVSAELFSDDGNGQAVGSAMISYAKIERARANAWNGIHKARRIDFKWPDGSSGLERHVLAQTGLRDVDKHPDDTVLEMSEYVRNSFGSLQGGMIALMADVAGQSAARKAAGHRLTTADLVIHYLSPGRFGPFTTSVRVLRIDKFSALCRIEIKDTGDNQRLIAVAMHTAVFTGDPLT